MPKNSIKFCIYDLGSLSPLNEEIEVGTNKEVIEALPEDNFDFISAIFECFDVEIADTSKNFCPSNIRYL